jgi:hypothetical protein
MIVAFRQAVVPLEEAERVVRGRTAIAAVAIALILWIFPTWIVAPAPRHLLTKSWKLQVVMIQTNGDLISETLNQYSSHIDCLDAGLKLNRLSITTILTVSCEESYELRTL